MIGVGAGMALLLIHLATIKSLGQPYLYSRSILRKRLKNQKHRNRRLDPVDEKNQKENENNP